MIQIERSRQIYTEIDKNRQKLANIDIQMSTEIVEIVRYRQISTKIEMSPKKSTKNHEFRRKSDK